MNKALRVVAIFLGLLLIWAFIVWAFVLPPFILPYPWDVALAWWSNLFLLLDHAGITLAEIALGLATGISLGGITALLMAYFRPARRWLFPVLLTSQAVPVFAIAPILMLWLGFGMSSKVAMTTLIIYFPVTSAFFDGLRRTEPGWLDLANSLGASRWRVLTMIRLPAALPSLASGIRVATAVAPIGAVVGEWVGASAGLGYLMLHANGRVQTSLMFAALLTLAIMAVALYYAVDLALRWALPWQPESDPSQDRR